MEIQILSFSIILLPFLAFIFMVWMIRRKLKLSHSITYLLPPGPRKLPLIGNIHNLVSSLPHRRLRDLAKRYGPIMNLQLGEMNMIVISSPETVKEVMATQDVNFAQRPAVLAVQIITYGCTDIGFSPYGEYWRQLRKMCVLELLSAKRVQSFKSIREEEVTKLVRSISSSCAGTRTNFSLMVHSLTYNITSRVAFGMISSDDEEAFLSTIREMGTLTSGFNISDMYSSIKLLYGMRSKVEKLHQELDRILESIINEHKARRAGSKPRANYGNKDIVDVLLDIQEQQEAAESPLTTNNVKAVLFDLFFAGTDTSATTIEWAMSELVRDPTVMVKAQTEVRQVFGRTGNIDEADFHQLHYLNLVIKETLRLHPPAPLLPRESRSKCEINGYDIPAKSLLMVNVWALGRDPNYWNEAERFYPERFLDSETNYKGTHFEFIPFGAGRRMCPGILLGIASVEIALAYLLYHFSWELPDGVRPENLDMSENFGTVVNRKIDLLLVPQPYHTQPVK